MGFDSIQKTDTGQIQSESTSIGLDLVSIDGAVSDSNSGEQSDKFENLIATSSGSGNDRMIGAFDGQEDFKLVSNNEMESPKDAGDIKNSNPNPTEYTIGTDGQESNVKVEYSGDTINQLEIKRPSNGESILYLREQADPQDASSPMMYTESRNGMKGDLFYGGLDVEKDGRINLYFDFNKKQLAISFNPSTGQEEYP